MPPLVRLCQALHAAPCHRYMDICGVIGVKQYTRPSSRDCAQQTLFCMLCLQHRHPEATMRAASLLPLPVFVSSRLRMCSSLRLWFLHGVACSILLTLHSTAEQCHNFSHAGPA
jgi:hypothetical protein